MRVLALAAALLVWTCAGQDPDATLGTPISEVEVRGIDDPSTAKVMLINARGESCSDTVVLSLGGMYEPGSRMLRFGGHVLPECWCAEPAASNAGLAVLAPGRSAAYVRNQRKRSHLPYSLCQERETPYVVKMRPRRGLTLNVWAPTRKLKHMAQDEVVNADWILDKELAGITLSPTFHVDKTELASLACGGDETDECCERVTQSRFYQAGAINIVYGAGPRNFACPLDVSDVIFIRANPVLGDVAHELGHRLGLSQSDNSGTRYEQGHTTNIEPFDPHNVMWEKAQQLKHRLSPAQAFWMSQSCGSYFASNSSCLDCSPERTRSSECPQFSEGARQRFPWDLDGPVCSRPKDNAQVMMADGRPPKGDVPSTIFCSVRDLEDELGKRYSATKQHRKGRQDLELGSVTKGDFVDRWRPQFQTVRPQSTRR